MKANAPEKIHVQPNAHDRWFEGKIPSGLPNGLFVEYTRTDAFIEKAEKFFTEKFEVEDYNDHIDIDGTPIFSYGRFIEDFRNYMKGE